MRHMTKYGDKYVKLKELHRHKITFMKMLREDMTDVALASI